MTPSGGQSSRQHVLHGLQEVQDGLVLRVTQLVSKKVDASDSERLHMRLHTMVSHAVSHVVSHSLVHVKPFM